MARCCGGSGSNTKITEGRHVDVNGIGTAQDPFVIDATTHLEVEDTSTFHLVLSGGGTLDDPWTLRVAYADTGRLDDLPDVEAPDPTNGQVLSWDETAGRWVPAASPTAAPGALSVGNGIEGDGSVGDPVEAKANAARYISVTASGIGLSDAGVNRMVRVFADDFARDNADPAPEEGTVALVQTDTSVLWYYDGALWQQIIEGVGRDIVGQLLSTSGGYSDGPVTKFIRQITTTTDGTGAFVAISAADLTDYSGVLSCQVSPVGTGTAWAPMLVTGAGLLSVRAKRLTDGAAHAGASITCVVEATLY